MLFFKAPRCSVILALGYPLLTSSGGNRFGGTLNCTELPQSCIENTLRKSAFAPAPVAGLSGEQERWTHKGPFSPGSVFSVLALADFSLL